MKRALLSTALAALLSAGFAWAKDVTPADAEKINAALALFGCSGGDMQQEESGIFEVDDAQCKDGQYDVKLDENFKVLSLTRD